MSKKPIVVPKSKEDLAKELDVLLSKKQYGDVKLVGTLLGTTKDNASRLLSRPDAKRHPQAVAALSRVIASRELLQPVE